MISEEDTIEVSSVGGRKARILPRQLLSDIIQPRAEESESFQLPDLFLRDAASSSTESRVTVSGTDNFFRHDWVEPEVVSFPHPDGNPVWAALYEPRRPAPERPAVLHIHGGGYWQFSHRDYSVCGYGLHLGLLQYLVQSGYAVLDLERKYGSSAESVGAW